MLTQQVSTIDIVVTCSLFCRHCTCFKVFLNPFFIFCAFSHLPFFNFLWLVILVESWEIFILIALGIRPQHVLAADSLILLTLCEDSSFTVYIEDLSSTLWIRPLRFFCGFVYSDYRSLVFIVSVGLSTVVYRA